ncbi:MAG: MFS transporter [Candidatus Sericytochromatia bacterium]
MKKAPLLILFLTVFIDLVGFGMVLPLLPYYAVRFGADAFAVGALLAVYSVMQLIFSPIWGRLSDRVGRRPLLLMSLLGSSIGLVVFGLADTLWLLFLSRAFSGVTAATISIAQAYIADSTTPENRAKGMGIIGAAFGLGFVFGPALGGVLAQFGHGTPAFVAAGLAFANFLFALVKLPESLPPEARGQEVVRGFSLKRLGTAAQVPGMRVLMAIYFVTVFAFATMEATFPLLTLHTFQFTEVQNGYVFAYLGVLIVILQGGLVGRLAKRFGEKPLVIAGTVLLAIGLGLLPFAPTVAMLLIVLVPLAAGNGLANPALTALISRTAASSSQGEVLGVGQSLASLGRILGPLWGGFAYAYLGMNVSYVIAGVMMLMLTPLAFAIHQPLAAAEPAAEPAGEPTT